MRVRGSFPHKYTDITSDHCIAIAKQKASFYRNEQRTSLFNFTSACQSVDKISILFNRNGRTYSNNLTSVKLPILLEQSCEWRFSLKQAFCPFTANHYSEQEKQLASRFLWNQHAACKNKNFQFKPKITNGTKTSQITVHLNRTTITSHYTELTACSLWRVCPTARRISSFFCSNDWVNRWQIADRKCSS